MGKASLPGSVSSFGSKGKVKNTSERRLPPDDPRNRLVITVHCSIQLSLVKVVYHRD